MPEQAFDRIAFSWPRARARRVAQGSMCELLLPSLPGGVYIAEHEFRFPGVLPFQPATRTDVV